MFPGFSHPSFYSLPSVFLLDSQGFGCNCAPANRSHHKSEGLITSNVFQNICFSLDHSCQAKHSHFSVLRLGNVLPFHFAKGFHLKQELCPRLCPFQPSSAPVPFPGPVQHQFPVPCCWRMKDFSDTNIPHVSLDT